MCILELQQRLPLFALDMLSPAFHGPPPVPPTPPHRAKGTPVDLQVRRRGRGGGRSAG